MPYLLDANVFMQAKNLHYGLDFCPAFWDWLVASNAAQRVFSIEKVEDEIQAGADELTTWAVRRGPGFFLKPDAAMLPALGRVSDWVVGQRYEPAAGMFCHRVGLDYVSCSPYRAPIVRLAAAQAVILEGRDKADAMRTA